MWPLVVLCALCVMSEHESPLLLSVFPPLHYLDTRYLMSFSRSTPALLATICSSVRGSVPAVVRSGISRVQHCRVQHHYKGPQTPELTLNLTRIYCVIEQLDDSIKNPEIWQSWVIQVKGYSVSQLDSEVRLRMSPSLRMLYERVWDEADYVVRWRLQDKHQVDPDDISCPGAPGREWSVLRDDQRGDHSQPDTRTLSGGDANIYIICGNIFNL